MRQPPYTPFHDGPPQFNIGLRRIDPALWLTPDSEAAWLPEKNRRLDRDPDRYFRARPDSEPAQAEALALIEAAIGSKAADAEEPALMRAARLVSDDLILMEKHAAGWTATAMALCQPTFFSIEESFNRELFALHKPVPGGAPDLASKISRMFDRMPEGEVFERFNWTVQLGAERNWPHGKPMLNRLERLEPAESAEYLFLRVERQTLIRLPESGGIVFAIRICLDPFATALADPHDRDGFAKAWRAASSDALRYKRWAQFDPVVEAALTGLGATPADPAGEVLESA